MKNLSVIGFFKLQTAPPLNGGYDFNFKIFNTLCVFLSAFSLIALLINSAMNVSYDSEKRLYDIYVVWMSFVYLAFIYGLFVMIFFPKYVITNV